MKYIIELEKIPGTELYKAKGANTLVFDKQGINNILTIPTADIEYQQGYADGYEKGYKDGELHAKTTLYDEYDYKMSYKTGLNDAWECARKLIHPSLGGLLPDDKQEIFGEPESDYVLLHYSASEAVAKVEEYEDRQKWVEEWNRKQAEQLCNKVCDDELKVGDEVYFGAERAKAVISRVAGFGTYNIVHDNGKTNGVHGNSLKKTGRHFPQIAEVLERMRGDKE